MKHMIWKATAVATLALGLHACGGGGGGGDSGGGSPLPVPPAPAAGIIGDGRLPELLEWARASNGLPAMALVYVQNGQIVEQAAVGRRSLSLDVPVTTADRWHVGSLTKAMTATLAAVLVEQSLIGWDTTPLEVWPELDASIHPRFRAVTLRQLLSHTSGMVRDRSWSDTEDGAPGTPMQKRRLSVERLLAESPVGSAGQFLYSNAGYVVAGAMLETRTGTPWETLLTEQVFAPLGMTESGFGAPVGASQSDQPWGHWDRGSRFEAVPPGPGADNARSIGPAGTVHTTLADYTRFMMAHLAGARGVPGLVTVPTFATLHTPIDDSYALGWLVVPNLADLGSVGLTHNGSNLRWLAQVWLLPARDAGVFIVSNAGGVRAELAMDALGDLFRERFVASR